MPLLRWQVVNTTVGAIALCQRNNAQSLEDVIETIAVDPRFPGVDEVIVREPVFINADLPTEKIELKRVLGIPVRRLGSKEYRLYLGPNVNLAARDDDQRLTEGLLFELCREELKYFAEEAGAILPRLPSGRYKSPSGRFVRRFLRAGNTQSSQSVLDAFFFWLLPTLKGKTAIATDTWSISSLALNACRRLAQYDVECLDTKFYILPHYTPAVTGKDAMLALAEAMQKDNSLFILSVSHSGDAIAKIADAFNRVRFRTGKYEVVVLYNVGENETDGALCSLKVPYGPDFKEDADPPALGSPIVEIHKYTLYPSNFVDRAIEPKLQHGKGIYQFLSRYGQHRQLLSVHRRADSMAGARHSAFWVDTEALSDNVTFQADFKEIIGNSLPTPRIVLHYPHEAGKKLAALAKEVCPDAKTWPYPTLQLLTEDEKKLLLSAEAILVIDDAYITGRRILNYQQQLRDLRFPGVIHYRIGVARPSDLAEWRTRRARLSSSLFLITLSPPPSGHNQLV